MSHRTNKSHFALLFTRMHNAVDTPSQLLESLNEHSEDWQEWMRPYALGSGTEREVPVRDVSLIVTDLYPDLRFSCAADGFGHRYAITGNTVKHFVPEAGQVIAAKVRRAFVIEALETGRVAPRRPRTR